MTRRTYPEAGELWQHPATKNLYRVHSRTDDGWTRYHTVGLHNPLALLTMPTQEFTGMYQRVTGESS